MHIQLEGRAALITGGSRGLGLATAISFAKAGASVAILARNSDDVEAAREQLSAIAPGRVLALAGDVTDADDCARAVEEAVVTFGSLDILVNNAGSGRRSEFLALPPEDLEDDYRLKVVSAFRIAQLATPHLIRSGRGRIINVVTSNAKAPSAGSMPTALSRAAGITLTKVLSLELAKHGILVNAIALGLLRSTQWNRLHQRVAPETDFDEFFTPFIARIPLGRAGEAEDFAALATFLSSDQAGFITGTAINLDGGTCAVT